MRSTRPHMARENRQDVAFRFAMFESKPLVGLLSRAARGHADIRRSGCAQGCLGCRPQLMGPLDPIGLDSNGTLETMDALGVPSVCS